MTDTTHPLSPLTAISALDGRYRRRVAPLAEQFSEYALMRARVEVEVAWFLALAAEPAIEELPNPAPAAVQRLQDRVHAFDLTDAERIKHYERRTNHDVKAVEYFVKDLLAEVPELAPYVEFVHFACTSEDINNCAYALLLKRAREREVLPALERVRSELDSRAQRYAAQPMLARTHGQPATPTTLGKEFRTVERRLARQLLRLAEVQPLAKLNGAVGNFNAHTIAYPSVDWPALSNRVLGALELTANPHTTQIEPHDWIAELCDAQRRVNTVLLDLCRDLWGYIAVDYFTQEVVAGETGSSTMPHKVNPIDFENAEGNLGLSNALLGHLADKLPVSRWQRDLSDSTALRSLGSAFAHAFLACDAIVKGLGKLRVNGAQLDADLDANWEVLGEAVQTVMRRHGLAEPYERLKAATRGRKLTRDNYRELLEALELPAAALAALEHLTPATYLGLGPELAQALDTDSIHERR
ncbi:MAG: adenylosuccinate lyase [Pseudomonadota bacterium]